jgi:hypothetical protein
MLPPFIIEQIRRREEELQRRHEQPQIEMPLPSNLPYPAAPERRDQDERGPVIVDL